MDTTGSSLVNSGFVGIKFCQEWFVKKIFYLFDLINNNLYTKNFFLFLFLLVLVQNYIYKMINQMYHLYNHLKIHFQI